jgi:hypothetical protein
VTGLDVAAGERRVVARWAAATFLGWVIGFFLMLGLVGLGEAVGAGASQAPLGLGMGLGVGLLQARFVALWMGARRRAWIVATSLGLAAPFLLSDLADLGGLGLPYWLPAYVGAGGLTAGLAQALVLRAAPSARPMRIGIWIVASIVGWSLAASTVAVNDAYLPRIPGLFGALLYVAVVLLGGIALGLVGGAAMSWTLGSIDEG